MLGLDYRVARATWTVLVILLLADLVYLVRQTLILFIVAIMFAYLLWPLVDFLNRYLPGRSRTPALAIVYLLLVAVMVVAGVEIGSRVASEANSLAARVPDLVSRVEQATRPSVAGVAGSGDGLKAKALAAVRSAIVEHSRELFSVLPSAGLRALSYAGNLVFLILVPILSFFFLKDGFALQATIPGWVGDPAWQQTLRDITSDLNLLFAKYMRSLVLLALGVFVVFSVFFSLTRVPYAILLAAIAFPLEFVPVVGPAAAAAIILLVAGFSGYHHMLWLLAFLGLYRLFQDYVLSPRLMSEGMEMHPLLIIFGVLAGAHIGGIAGTVLAVPVLAALRVVYRRIDRPRAVVTAQS